MSGEPAVPLPRILVADDEPAISAIMAQMLGYAGFEVVRAGGGAEAVALARHEPPALILLDVMMPDLDGRDACQVLKADPALRHVPVLLFSSAEERDVHWAGAGADGFIQKPFRIRSLAEVVRGYLAGRPS